MMRFIHKLDLVLLISVLLITITGSFTILSLYIDNLANISTSLIIKHILSIILGVSVAIAISHIDYRGIPKLMRPFFLSIVGVLILVLLIGNTVNGAQSWFNVAGLNIQPSEFAKIIVIIIIAQYFSQYHHRLDNFLTIIASAIPVGIIGILIAIQPDFGTASIIALVWVGMVIFGGIHYRHILILGAFTAVSGITIWNTFLQDYQKQRIITFFDPTIDPLGSGYNTIQVIKSVSAGGLMGNNGVVVGVPEIHTDFIFAGFSQQWGFIGVLVYFLLLGIILWRILYIGIKSQDSFAKMLILGVVLCLIIQTTINIGMNIGVLPITGVPLPFMSYGVNSMVSSWILIGIALSVHAHQTSKGTIFMKDNQDIFG